MYYRPCFYTANKIEFQYKKVGKPDASGLISPAVRAEIVFDVDELHVLVFMGVNDCVGDLSLGGGGGMLLGGAEGTIRGGGMSCCLYNRCSLISIDTA
mgnify:CR=1 FL=1